MGWPITLDVVVLYRNKLRNWKQRWSPWTVQMYLVFALGRLDVLAPNDLGVRKGVMKLYGLEEMPTPTQVKNPAEKWHPLESVPKSSDSCFIDKKLD